MSDKAPEPITVTVDYGTHKQTEVYVRCRARGEAMSDGAPVSKPAVIKSLCPTVIVDQRLAPDEWRLVPGVVWVVIGHIDYEGDDIQSIHADEQSAQAERNRLAARARQAREDRKPAAHDSYTVERYEVER